MCRFGGTDGLRLEDLDIKARYDGWIMKWESEAPQRDAAEKLARKLAKEKLEAEEAIVAAELAAYAEKKRLEKEAAELEE